MHSGRQVDVRKRAVYVDVHPAHRVDDVHKTLKVHPDVVVDGDSQVVVDCLLDPFRTAPLLGQLPPQIRRIDPVIAVTGNKDP
jgi:hypothetical protein